MALRASKTSFSNASKVFKMIAEALLALSASAIKKLSMISLGSVVLKKAGKSLRRMVFIIPGVESTMVSKYPLVRQLSSVDHTQKLAPKLISFEGRYLDLN